MNNFSWRAKVAGAALVLAAFGAALLFRAEASGEQILVHGAVRVAGEERGLPVRGLKGLDVFAGKRGGFVHAVYFPETGEYAALIPRPAGRAVWQLGISVDPGTGFLPGDFDGALEFDQSMRTVEKDIFLERGSGLLMGTVRGSGGAASKSVYVKIREFLRGRSGESRELVAETDERGNYLAFVPAGRYVVQASSASEAGDINPESQTIEFGEGAEFREVSLSFRKTDVAIPVRAILGNGKPVAASVWAWSDRGGFARAKANAEGRATLAAFDHADVWHVSGTAEVEGISYASAETTVAPQGGRVEEQLLVLGQVDRQLPKERRIVADARKPLTVQLEGMTLYLPAGAAAEDGLLTVRVKPTFDVPARMYGVRTVGPAYDIEVANAEGIVSRLKKEGRIEIAAAASGGKSTVAIWSDAADAWVSIPSVATRETNGSFAIAALDHLSSFAATQPEPPPGGEGGVNPTPTPSPTPVPFTFSLSASSVSLTQGQSAVAQITVTATGGSARSVNFSVSGLPAGVSNSFSPLSCVPSPSCVSTLTISSSASTPVGNYSLTVSGNSPPADIGGSSSNSSTSFVLSVVAPASTPAPSPTATAAPTPTPQINPAGPVGGGSGLALLDARVARVDSGSVSEPAQATVVWIASQPARARASCNMTDTTGRRIVVDIPLTVFETVVGTLEIDIPRTIAGGSNAECAIVVQTVSDFQTRNLTFTVPSGGALSPSVSPLPAATAGGAAASPVSSSPQPTSAIPASSAAPRLTPAVRVSPAPSPSASRTSTSPVSVLPRAQEFSAALVPLTPLGPSSTGIAVTRLQQALNLVMPEGKIPVTGVYDPATIKAVVAFQVQEIPDKLAAIGRPGGTGIAGTLTLDALRAKVAAQGSGAPRRALEINEENRVVLGQTPIFAERTRLGFASGGPTVKRWQEFLNALGSRIPTTAWFGSITRTETRKFQQSRGIQGSGIVDAATIREANDIIRRLQ